MLIASRAVASGNHHVTREGDIFVLAACLAWAIPRSSKLLLLVALAVFLGLGRLRESQATLWRPDQHKLLRLFAKQYC